MEQKRVGGRFVREGLDGDGGAAKETRRKEKRLRPTSCKKFVRNRVAEVLPEILNCLVEEARKGSVAHLKLLASLGGLDKAEIPVTKKRRGKSMVALLMERLGEKPEPKDGGGK